MADTQTKGRRSTTSDSDSDEQGKSLFDQMEEVTELKIPLRGRAFDPDVLRIRDELEKMEANLKDGGEPVARSFKGVTTDNREEFARKIRAAGQIKPEIEVTTRLDKHANKLIWGPTSVLNKLAGKDEDNTPSQGGSNES